MSDATLEHRRYDGDRDSWTIDDANVGASVPLCVRRGGATRPMEREELGDNGLALRGHPTEYACETCGETRRFVTNGWMHHYHCTECDRVRWFRLKGVDLDGDRA